MEGTLHIFDDLAALQQAAAERLLAIGNQALAEEGAFHVALAGGSTPMGLYRLLAEEPYRNGIDWQKVHIYFGDERCVPFDDPDSNYGMACETLLRHIPIPPSQIHPISGELPPSMAAGEYADTLGRQLPRDEQQQPYFHLVLLGLGADGHIASLFPASEALQRRRTLVDTVHAEHLDSWRVTLTLPLLNHARHLILLVSGEAKADILRHIEHEIPGASPLPVQMLKPQGEMEWFVDEDAAQHLPR